jgi:hypothetical protein
MLDLVTGRRCFFILDDEPPLVAEVEIFDSQLFVVLRTEAPHRAEVRWQSRVAIIRALERSGLHRTPPGLLDSLEALKEWPPDDRERSPLGVHRSSKSRSRPTEAK